MAPTQPSPSRASAERSAPPGYHGQSLQIDLTRRSGDAIPLAEGDLRRFLGGCGLGTYLLLRHRGASVDALEPAAPLALAFGPLVGSPLTTSAKFAVVSKSPLTERINDSVVGGRFALAGKGTGFDALVLVGQAAEPSLVLVDEGVVQLEPAGRLWGMTCSEAEAELRRRLGSEFAVAVIGPAGEKQVRYASVASDGRHAGRGGHGAVLGAKNIKAVAVRGLRTVPWAHTRQLLAAAQVLSEKSLGPGTAKYRELGTGANLLLLDRLGALPTCNFQQGSFAGVAALAPETLRQTGKVVRRGCVRCRIGCEHRYRPHTPRGAAQPALRLDYQSLFALGPLCGIGNPEVVTQASHLADELGLDVISTGGTVAFAMECVARGLLNAPWLRFGDGGALLRAIREIGRREGLGMLLGEGSRRLAERLGGNAMTFAPQVKGLEIPGYDPRALQTMALGFAVGTRGADHNRSGAYEADFSGQVDRFRPGPEGVLAAIETENRSALIDSLILCKFLRGVFEDYYGELAEILRLVTGWDCTGNELRQTAQRIVAARKLYNIRAGWQPQEDTLPERFFTDPLPEYPAARLSPAEFHDLIAAYNTARGWSPRAGPEPEELDHLLLADL